MSYVDWKEVRMYPVSSHELKGAKVIKDYCMGGKSIITLTSPTGVHHSYYIRAPFMDDKENFREDIRFVYVLNHNNKWIYLGELYNQGTSFRKTRNSRYDIRSEEFRGMQYVVKMMNKDFKTNMTLHHEGCCCRCGRRLLDPDSISRGIGPKCFKVLNGEIVVEETQYNLW